MKRFLMLLLVACLMLGTLAGCSLFTDSNEPEPDPDPVPDVTEPEPDPEPYSGPVNPLTGLPTETDLSMQRPCAVMINNIKKANPQVGVSSADIIYEACVEGGITRMMAVYQDLSVVDVIGSVRSARHYFLDLAQPLDAIYIHAGGSDQAYSAISSRGIAHIDGVNGTGETFYRDADRKAAMGYEHSLMLSTEKVPGFLDKYNMRKEHEEGYSFNMKFTEDATPQNGSAANSIDITFSKGSSGKNTVFEYNASDKLYYVSQYGAAYKDDGNGQQVAVTNVLVLFAPTKQISGDEKGRLDVTLTGSGEGYFVCGGKYVNLTWSKEDASSQFKYTLEDGSELVFGAGKSYINIVPVGNDVVFA